MRGQCEGANVRDQMYQSLILLCIRSLTGDQIMFIVYVCISFITFRVLGRKIASDNNSTTLSQNP